MFKIYGSVRLNVLSPHFSPYSGMLSYVFFFCHQKLQLLGIFTCVFFFFPREYCYCLGLEFLDTSFHHIKVKEQVCYYVNFYLFFTVPGLFCYIQVTEPLAFIGITLLIYVISIQKISNYS